MKKAVLNKTHVSRFARAHNPLNEPPFGFREILIAIFIAALGYGVTYAPGFVADFGRITIGTGEDSYEYGVLVRIFAAALNAWALLGVRAMHPLTRAAHLLVVLYLGLRVAEVRITHEPLTVAFAILAVIFCILAARTITRPNDAERLQLLEQRIAEEMQL